MDAWIQDFHMALRLSQKNRGFAAVIVLTLALGIGANTTIFSLVNAVLLRRLPFKNPDQLVWIWSSRADGHKTNFSLPDFMDYRDANRTLDQMAAFAAWNANLENAGEPERLFGVRASANVFQMLGVEPEAGRLLLDEDDKPGNPRIVVLSHGFWNRRFGGSADMLGKQITLDDVTYSVAGILPAGFSFPGMEADIVVPLVPDADPLRNERSSISFLRVIGRLKDGFTRQQAEADLNGIAGRLQGLYPAANASKKGTVLVPLKEQLVGNYRLAFSVLSAAVGLVLLIACANLANLVLARASTRYREMAIRMAIGASRLRMIRQLLTENILLALLGGCLGLLLTRPAIKVIIALSPASLPHASEIQPDARVLLFTLLISLLSGVLFGLLPALSISKQNLAEELKGSGKGTSDGSRGNRVRNLLILSEIALSLLLLIGGGLLAKSFLRLQAVSPGFAIRNLLVARLSLPKTPFSNPESVTSFQEQLSAGIEALPGALSAGAIAPLPLSGANVRVPFIISDRPALPVSEQPVTEYRMTGPNYFHTMSIPLQSGRDFTNRDTSHSQPVAMINETFARRYWPGSSPVGAHIKLDDNNRGPREVEIIGVVGDVRHTALNVEPAPETYVPISQVPEESVFLLTNNLTWVVRTSAEPLALAAAVRREIQSVNGKVATGSIKSMEQLLASSLTQGRFNLFLLGAFALAALTLAGMGVYAVISFSVAQRAQELAIRMALGAQKFDVLSLVVGGGLKMVLTGVAIGLVGAGILTRVMANLLYGVGATDPPTFAFMALLLVLTTMLASYLPARRAARVDPLAALRAE